MLSTIALVVAGLSTGHKIGLASVGAAFIVFALISSFVLPRRDPDFPGKHLGWYVVVAVAFFVAMISAVLIFGKEKPEKASAAPPPTATSPGAPAPSGGSAPSAAQVTAGEAVFKSAGCTGCHTLKAAGSTGTVGPNLDQLKPTDAAVVHQVTVGGGVMPSFKGQLSTQQIQDVAAFVSSSAGK